MSSTRSKSMSEGEDAFIERLLARHAQQPRHVLLPVTLTVLVIAAIAASAVPLVWIAVWLALVAGVLAIRWFVVGKLDQPLGRSARQRLHLAVWLMGLSGFVHALSLGFFAYLPPFERAIHSMLLVGLSAGCVATASGYPPLFRVYAGATLGPLAVLWAIGAGPAGADWIPLTMAFIMVLFGLAFDLLARDTFRLFKESFDYRLELQAALDSAEKASRAKTRFLASASHDLRQPTQTLSLFAAALAMRPLDAKSREITGYMNDALHDLNTELDSLLDISKLDAGVVNAMPAVFQLRSILNRLQGICAPLAEQKHLRFSVACPAGIHVNVDRQLFDRMLRNLIENAIKYTDSGGSVHVHASIDQQECVLSIIDSGCGIPESEHERIFEEFYQLGNPERDRSRGLGLGLAIVRRLSELMSIRLTLTSTPKMGSTFELRLALAQGETEAAPASPLSISALNGLRALIVDDEESVRLAMGVMLEEVNCKVLLAADSAEAARIAASIVPDVLIADFRLRGSDSGLQTISQVRTLHPQLPALLVSGDTAPDRLREALEAGVPILHKPVAAQALLQEILKLTQNNKRGAGHVGTSEAAPSALDLSRV